MSSLARPGRVIRAAPAVEEDEVFVLGERARAYPVHHALATADDIAVAARQQAAGILANAEGEAARILAEAQAAAGSVRSQAYDAGYQAGLEQGASEVEACVDLARRAANEGKAIRDDLANQASGVVARAVSLALRRVVGEYYEADPARTLTIVQEALRAAAGQEILAIRVSPGLVDSVTTALADVAEYVRPDSAVAIGGCLVDVRDGAIDASLDARLALMDLALRQSGGEASL